MDFEKVLDLFLFEDICIIYENVYFSFQKSKGQGVHSKPGGTALLELGYCLAAQGPSPSSDLRPKSKFNASPLHTAFPYHPYIVMN